MVALTEDDAKVLAVYSQQPIAVVVNGTDTEAFAEVVADSGNAQARRLLHVGTFAVLQEAMRQPAITNRHIYIGVPQQLR